MILNNLSGTKEKPIIFNSYGYGNKPKFSVVAEFKLNWSKIGGNIWRCSTNLQNYYPRRLKFDGIEVLQGFYYHELGKNVPDQVKWFYGNNGDTNNNLYIYSSDSPSNHIIEFSNKSNTIKLYRVNYLIFDNIELIGGFYENLTIEESKNILIKDLSIGDMAANGLTSKTFGKINCENIVIDNCLFDTKFILDYSNIGTYDGASSLGAGDGIRFETY